jgi:hypothetical protein
MLNKITGWLIFAQLGYVMLFVAVSIINFATNGEVANQLESIRRLIGLSNQHVRLNDYVCYPLALSAPINMFLALLYFWNLLRKNQEIDFSPSFFNIINAVYVAAGSWLFTSVFCSLVN